ncbi:flippase-like domain-containing protein [Flaviaesturariibacter flavus]|uniref:Flippase-like domain-containing protein n=1 Tax=Flaviaesturariibacter flavus TaxID=2502780 RepID=A0A4R1BPH6_9BACT|nr:lysylphosphatidylglycerol synthase transmembrane domain-containing protein [Flaviaesturariibacter flavus]TCJ19227.1 flippase-like domain-containing protein [Flaviaesturariibacter flavus]
MKKRVLTIVQYLFFLGLGLFFVWLSIKDIDANDWEAIKGAVERSRKWLILPAFLLLTLAHYSRALRWRILMEPLGYRPSRFNVFASVMIGYLVNAAVPRLGEVVKCTLLARYEKTRVDKLIGTIVMERAVDVICLVAAFAAAFVFQGHVITTPIVEKFSDIVNDGSGHVSARKVIFLLGGITVVVGGVIFFMKRFAHIDFVGKIRGVLSGIGHGLSSIRFIRNKAGFLFHTMLIWGLYLSGTTLGIYALQETAHLGINGGLTTLALGSIGMVVTPGGIGAYPLLIGKLMSWYGLDEDTIGVALGWLLWVVQTLVTLIVGLLCFAYLSHHNKNRSPENGTIVPE